MIGIGRHTDYAARIVLHLATLEDGARASIAAIAEKRLLPQAFVRRIVGKLVAAGIVATVRGARGGLRLARPAAEISLLDVVRALEGGIVLNRCVDTPRACPLSSLCPVQREWARITRNLETDMARTTFATLADRLEGKVTKHGYPRGGKRRPADATKRGA